MKENCREGDGGIRHVEMLYRCNYVGLVGGGSINPKYLKTKGIYSLYLFTSPIGKFVEFCSDYLGWLSEKDCNIIGF